MGKEETAHETDSKARVKRFQEDLNSNSKDPADTNLNILNSRVDTQLKIEEFMIRWREANHAWFNVWAPTIISVVVAAAGIGAGFLGYVTHDLERKKASVEIVLKAVGGTPQETLANLNRLKEAGLLDLSTEQINKLSSLKPAPGK